MSLLALALLLQLGVVQRVEPVLEFPEPGLDDPAAYEGYRTRVLRDALGNAVQVYLNGREGRVVVLWANALNESAAFTARDASDRPVPLDWASAGAGVGERAGLLRTVEYELIAPPSPLRIGLIQLGSMRWERDLQYQRGHLGPLDAPVFRPQELLRLVGHLERLDAAERGRHLALLRAADVAELRGRLEPRLSLSRTDSAWTLRAEGPSFDARTRLSLELSGDRSSSGAELEGRTLRVRPLAGDPIRLRVRVTTDAAALTPLRREEIFSRDFLRFYDSLRADGYTTGADALRLRRLERQIRGVELLCYGEKLMAGLPNFATYFGRDMLMTALMMAPVWTEEMKEHVIGGVLRKLSPEGEVSHEEALGGQAVREHAADYDELMTGYFARRSSGDDAAAADLLTRARSLLGDLQAVREDYRMRDDDFQLPVLVARYLADPGISDARKRAFLLARVREGASETRLRAVLRNLAYVARTAEPYAREPRVENLVEFARLGDGRWHAGSWRDSGVGYAGGRYAMDINGIWVPASLRALGEIVASLRSLGWTVAELAALAPEMRGTPLARLAGDGAALNAAIRTWSAAIDHFRVELDSAAVRQRVAAKLASLPEEERRYWEGVLAGGPFPALRFSALSLDEVGRPIPVLSTDPAMRLFLGAVDREEALRDAEAFVTPYPIGLLVAGLGPLVANDAYASPAVWELFREDLYHSPRVVWGREVNLILLGLARQLQGAAGEPARELYDALRAVRGTVEASGLKHSELWSYRMEGGRLTPVRYGTGSDVQLWNTTDLVVQYELARLPAARN